ncbi:MAG: type II secretion system protein [Patescibacteria group bacterium]
MIKQGFTLMEILIVMAIMAILTTSVLIIINPFQQFAQARNNQRLSHIMTILNSVSQYMTDNNNSLPSAISGLATSTFKEICMTDAASCSNLIDLSVLTNNELYLVSLPIDPSCSTSGCGSASGTGYWISRSANNRITAYATSSELGKDIRATR